MEEIPLYRPCGEGPHVWCEIEKSELTTDEAISALCEAFGLDRRMVGYAGRKDRNAVARQWLSLPRIERVPAEEIERFRLPGLSILRAALHREKLRLGQLRGNRFEIVVRERWPEEPAGEGGEADSTHELAVKLEGLLGRRIGRVQRRGLCNRFGEQRFGRRNDNAQNGAALLRGEMPVREHHLARLLVSAFQSELFHRTLEMRHEYCSEHSEHSEHSECNDELDACATLLPGDIVFDHTSGFNSRLEIGGEERGSEEQRRAEALEISATGPLFGPDMWRARAVVAEIEQRVLEEADLDLEEESTRRVSSRLRLRGSRRPLRVPVRDLEFESASPTRWRDERNESELRRESSRAGAQPYEAAPRSIEIARKFRFELPPGAYATVLLQQLYGDLTLVDGSRESR